MTERKDLLRPAEPARRLAPVDRKTLEALQATVGECACLIAAQGAEAQQAAARQQELLQACVDELRRFGERLDGQDDAGSSRHAELTEAVGKIPAAIAGVPKGSDEARSQDTAGMRADLATLRGTLEQIVGVMGNHNSQLLAMVDAVTVLAAAVAALDAHGESARQARTSRNHSLADLVNGTATLAARIGRFEEALARRKTDFWPLVTIPLLLALVFGAGMMTDVMIRFIDGSAGQSVPLATELLPWPLPDAGQEAATPE